MEKVFIECRTTPMIYGLLLMSPALYKAASLWRTQSGMTTTRLIKVLVRVQVVYFLAYVCYEELFGSFI